MEEQTQVVETAAPKQKSRIGKIIWLIVGIVVLLLAGLVAWLSFGKPSNLQTKMYRVLPYPAAFVNGKPILAKEMMNRFDVAKNSLPPEAGVSDNEIKQQVFDRLVNEEKLTILARSKGVGVKDSELDQQYQDAVQQLTNGDQNQFKEMLSSYGLNESDFKKQVLKPDALMSKLVVWFNEQRDLNKEAYGKADSLQQQLASGTSFETIAASSSEDTASQGMEGDLGFVDVTKLLPEFKDALSGLAKGQTKLVASRYGLHLFKVEDTDPQNASSIHLKQVFISSNGFEQWYQNATKNYSVKKTIKL